MRLFVGVELSDAARALAADVARGLGRRLGKTLTVRWVAPENLHLTIRFIGYVVDEKVPALIETLVQPLDIAPFEIELAGLGTFPPRGAPRVIWIGLAKGLPSLAALHNEFNRRLASHGLEPEDRPYSAHLTLARIKDARAADAKSIGRAFDGISATGVTMRVNAVTIFESRLSAAGASYVVVNRVRLRP
jgi:2'-5' RNA ligase